MSQYIENTVACQKLHCQGKRFGNSIDSWRICMRLPIFKTILSIFFVFAENEIAKEIKHLEVISIVFAKSYYDLFYGTIYITLFD